MRNVLVCLVDDDAAYVRAFMRAVALSHAGVNVVARRACGEDCKREFDVCLQFKQSLKGREPQTEPAQELSAGGVQTGDSFLCECKCGLAFIPGCGRYGGANAILSEVRACIFDRQQAAGQTDALCGPGGPPVYQPLEEAHGPLPPGSLICVYACTGGTGTSVAAIGIGRELARYRGERVLYLSLEEAEDFWLFPASAVAMRAEEVLYRYLRIQNSGAGQRQRYNELFRAAVVQDEYGLYRLAPDEGPGSLAGLAPDSLYKFLIRFAGSLRLSRIVIDFGTRLLGLSCFAAVLGKDEAVFLEALSSDGDCARKRREFLRVEMNTFSMIFPFCEEDVREAERYTDVCLANAFGVAVKDVCDRLTGISR